MEANGGSEKKDTKIIYPLLIWCGLLSSSGFTSFLPTHLYSKGIHMKVVVEVGKVELGTFRSSRRCFCLVSSC